MRSRRLSLRRKWLRSSAPVRLEPSTAFLSSLQLTILQLKMLKTNIPDHVRKSSSEEAISVIHAPEGFQQWVGSMTMWGIVSTEN